MPSERLSERSNGIRMFSSENYTKGTVLFVYF